MKLVNIKFRRSIAIVLLIIGYTAFGQIKHIDSEESWKTIDSLFSDLNNKNSPGVSIAVTWNHKPVYVKSYGMADIENKIKVNKETAFNLASLTKQFTAYAVLLLSEEGKLSMEDPITKYLPELPYNNVSVRHLMNQISGIPGERISRYGSFSGTGKKALLTLYGSQSLTHEPGTKWNYNNNNYNLLSIIVERVSGKTLPNFLSENVFIPLGMTQSYFPFGPGATKENRAYGYMKRNDKWVNVDKNDVYLSLVGGGGMYSSIRDLMKWDKAFYSKNYAAKQRRVDGKYASGKEVSYGAGVNVSNQDGIFSIEHGGTSGATSTYMAQYPEYGASIIILVASNHYHSIQGSKTLVQQIKKKLFERFNSEALSKNKEQSWTSWSIDKIKAKSGTWFGELNGTLQQVNVTANENGSIKLAFFDGFSIDLHQIGNNTFESKVFTGIQVHVEDDKMSFLDDKKELGSIKKTSKSASNTLKLDLTGNYTASALNNSVWAFSNQNEVLKVTNPSGRTIKLEPIHKNIVGNTRSNIYFEQIGLPNGKETWVLMAGQIPKIQLHATSVQQAIPLIKEALELGGSEAAKKQFQTMRKQSEKFDFSERGLNSLGYSLLRKKQPIEALTIFKMMTETFPKSVNALDSFADGLLANEKIGEAKKAYQRILKLDPYHANAKRMLNRLQKTSN